MKEVEIETPDSARNHEADQIAFLNSILDSSTEYSIVALDLDTKITANEREQAATAAAIERARQRQKDLEASPEARSHRQLLDLGTRAEELGIGAAKARGHAGTATDRATEAKRRADEDAARLNRDVRAVAEAGQSLAVETSALRVVTAAAISVATPDADARRATVHTASPAGRSAAQGLPGSGQAKRGRVSPEFR